MTTTSPRPARRLASRRALLAVLALVTGLVSGACGTEVAQQPAEPDPGAAARADEAPAASGDARTTDKASRRTTAGASGDPAPPPYPTSQDYVDLLGVLGTAAAAYDPGADPAGDPGGSLSFPAGVELVQTAPGLTTFCLQDTIAGRSIKMVPSEGADRSDVILIAGLCRGGDRLARIVSTGPADDAFEIKGDEDLARPVVEFATGSG